MERMSGWRGDLGMCVGRVRGREDEGQEQKWSGAQVQVRRAASFCEAGGREKSRSFKRKTKALSGLSQKLDEARGPAGEAGQHGRAADEDGEKVIAGLLLSLEGEVQEGRGTEPKMLELEEIV